jgi:formiminoglutamase
MFAPIDPSLFFSKGDQADLRFGDLALPTPQFKQSSDFKTWLEARKPQTRDYVIAGYPDDEGIRINGGRPGAGLAPNAIRKPFYKMTPSSLSSDETPHTFIDLGNLETSSLDLAHRHQSASQFGQVAMQSGLRWIALGGGHDYGFADADAFLSIYQSRRPVVINFDAHLDVRPTTAGFSSGTPFFRMLEKYPGTEFYEVGLQTQCNAKAHLEWAEARGAKFLFQEQVEASGQNLLSRLQKLLGEAKSFKGRPTFLSVDIDGFSSSVAPGCSQSWATGFLPHDFFQCFAWLTSLLDVRALGLYEVSPPLDQDDRTSKLAAVIIHRYVTGNL